MSSVRMPEEEARRRFAAARVARLATAPAGGRPHVVPVTFAAEGDRIYTAVDHKPKTTANLRRLRNIMENPLVSVLADHYSDDWDELWWVRADGRAALLGDPAGMAGPLALLADRYPQYRDARPGGPVIAITVHHWTAWSFCP